MSKKSKNQKENLKIKLGRIKKIIGLKKVSRCQPNPVASGRQDLWPPAAAQPTPKCRWPRSVAHTPAETEGSTRTKGIWSHYPKTSKIIKTSHNHHNLLSY